MKNLVTAVLKESKAHQIVAQIQNKLQEEEKKRQAFYEMIDEDTKAEFINGEVIYHSPVKKEHNDAPQSPQVVLMTGANGFLGHILCLKWMEKIAQVGGKLILKE